MKFSESVMRSIPCCNWKRSHLQQKVVGLSVLMQKCRVVARWYIANLRHGSELPLHIRIPLMEQTGASGIHLPVRCSLPARCEPHPWLNSMECSAGGWGSCTCVELSQAVTSWPADLQTEVIAIIFPEGGKFCIFGGVDQELGGRP